MDERRIAMRKRNPTIKQSWQPWESWLRVAVLLLGTSLLLLGALRKPAISLRLAWRKADLTMD